MLQIDSLKSSAPLRRPWKNGIAVGRAFDLTRADLLEHLGWIQREIDTFVERGFTPVSIGEPILRVEAALSATLGQLLVLQRLRG